MKMIRSLLSLSFFLLGCLPLIHASESAEAERLKAVIMKSLDVIHSDAGTSLSETDKQSRVRSLIEQEYDLSVIIRRAIGRNWRLMEADEQERVLELVKQLIIKAFVNALDGSAYPEFSMGEVIGISDKRLEIPSSVKFEGTHYKILFRLGKMRTGWQIYDIVAEDISVVANYRQQIDDHFKNGTGVDLINKLEDLLTKEDLDENIQL